MKICEHCHAVQEDDAAFCAVCGQPMAEKTEPAPEAQPEQKKQNKRGLIVGIAAAAVVVAIGVGLFLGLRKPKTEEAVQQAPAAEETGEPADGFHHLNAYGYPSFSIHYEAAGDGASSYTFLDKDGQLVRSPIEDRLISTPLERLKAMPNVIGLAAGDSKIEAIRAVLRGGYLDILITDESTANLLLKDD